MGDPPISVRITDDQLSVAVRRATRRVYNRAFLAALPFCIGAGALIGRNVQLALIVSIALTPLVYEVFVTATELILVNRLRHARTVIAWYRVAVAGSTDALIRRGELEEATGIVATEGPTAFERERLSSLIRLARGEPADLLVLSKLAAADQNPSRALSAASVIQSLAALRDGADWMTRLNEAHPWAAAHLPQHAAQSLRRDLVTRRVITLVGSAAVGGLLLWSGLMLLPNAISPGFGGQIDPNLVGGAAYTKSSTVVDGQLRTWAPDMELASNQAVAVLLGYLPGARPYSGAQPDANVNPVWIWLPVADVPGLPAGAPGPRIDGAWVYFEPFFDSRIGVLGIRYHGEATQRYYVVDPTTMEELANVLYPVTANASF